VNISSGATPFYRVIYSGMVRGTLRGLGERARQREIGAEFVASLQTIETRPSANPLTVGEPLQFLPHLRLSVQLVGISFFYFRFAVDEERRLVYVIDCVGSARLEEA
jgi:hypothetical protein